MYVDTYACVGSKCVSPPMGPAGNKYVEVRRNLPTVTAPDEEPDTEGELAAL